MPAHKMNIDKAKSYATFAHAERHAIHVLNDYHLEGDENLNYFIAARADGRFVAVVIVHEKQSYLLRALVDRGMYVTN